MSFAVAALLLAGWLSPGATFSVDAPASSVRFEVVHKLHHVEGSSRDIEGKAVVKDERTVLAMIRIPVASFRSGDANRDAHMLEVLEIGEHPFVVFKGIARMPGGDGELGGPVIMEGEVDLHGVKRPVTVPVTVERAGGDVLRVRGSFGVSLVAHQIERPSLLFVKIDDDCRIHVDLALRRATP